MLEIRQLKVGYGGVEVLHGVDLDIGEGELVTVIGSNGAGKTTLLRTISGLLKPTGGSIRFNGFDIAGQAPDRNVREGLIHVPEGRMILTRMTVEENLQLGAYLRRDSEGISRDFNAVLQMFPRLSERLRQQAGTLSGGEQQMLAIGRGLMADPRLLMLDEPSLGVAPLVVDAIFEAIEAIRQRGVTILLVEQNARRALQAASQAYALELGSVSFSGTGASLLEDDRVRKAYLGV